MDYGWHRPADRRCKKRGYVPVERRKCPLPEYDGELPSDGDEWDVEKARWRYKRRPGEEYVNNLERPQCSNISTEGIDSSTQWNWGRPPDESERSWRFGPLMHDAWVERLPQGSEVDEVEQRTWTRNRPPERSIKRHRGRGRRQRRD